MKTGTKKNSKAQFQNINFENFDNDIDQPSPFKVGDVLKFGNTWMCAGDVVIVLEIFVDEGEGASSGHSHPQQYGYSVFGQNTMKDKTDGDYLTHHISDIAILTK